MARWLAIGLTLVLIHGRGFAQGNYPQIAADEALLRAGGVEARGEALLEYLRGFMLTAAQQTRASQLIQNLGDDQYRQRERASRDLVALGPAVVNLLRDSRHDPMLERRRRIAKCLAELEVRLAPARVEAALRLVKARPQPGATALLEGFLPFSWDGGVKNELASALMAHKPLGPHALDPSPTRQAGMAAECFFQCLLKGSMGKLKQMTAVPFCLDGNFTLETAGEFEELFAQVLPEWRKPGLKATWTILHVVRAADYPAPEGERRFLTRVNQDDVRVVYVRARTGSEEAEEGALFVHFAGGQTHVIGLGRRGPGTAP